MEGIARMVSHELQSNMKVSLQPNAVMALPLQAKEEYYHKGRTGEAEE